MGFDPEDIAIGDINVAQNGYVEYARQCGNALALAHSRADRRSVRFEAAVASQLTLNSDALVSAAQDYAQQVTNDCRLFAQMLG